MNRDCAVCRVTKPVEDFPPRRDRKSGVMSRCHQCDAQRAARYYEANRVQVLARQKQAKRRSAAPRQVRPAEMTRRAAGGILMA